MYLSICYEFNKKVLCMALIFSPHTLLKDAYLKVRLSSSVSEKLAHTGQRAWDRSLFTGR
ncbi:MAG: hypothetical protein NVSMB46_01760 [Candidatus Saccharimonadales bacterium]